MSPAAGLLRLGSPASPLARARAEWVAERLPGCPALVWVRAEEEAGEGVDALHRALLEDRIDVAVHSLEALPPGEEEGVLLACVPERADPRDALVAREGRALAALGRGARVGADTPLRRAQLARCRRDLELVPLAGDLHARLARVSQGDLDALCVARADLCRLGLRHLASEVLDPDVVLPAAGQGALGLAIRAGDAAAERALGPLRDVSAAACTTAERAALCDLGAGPDAPVAALACVEEGRLRLRVRLLSADGRESLTHDEEGFALEAAAVGARAARALGAQGESGRDPGT